jgi:hypothetical protein
VSARPFIYVHSSPEAAEAAEEARVAANRIAHRPYPARLAEREAKAEAKSRHALPGFNQRVLVRLLERLRAKDGGKP